MAQPHITGTPPEFRAAAIAEALSAHSGGWAPGDTDEQFSAAVDAYEAAVNAYLAAGMHICLVYPVEWPDHGPEKKLRKTPVFAKHCLTPEQLKSGDWDNVSAINLATDDVHQLSEMTRNFVLNGRMLHGKLMLPNLGMATKKSGIVVVDADTPDTVKAFKNALRFGDRAEYKKFADKPTVHTPGVVKDGIAVHRDGGHWYFISEDEDAAYPRPAGGYSIIYANLMVLLPGSRRTEGTYRAATNPHVGIAGSWLTAVSGDKPKTTTPREQRPQHEDATDVDRWSADHTWDSILTNAEWTKTGTSSCGPDCTVWKHPKATSSRSAIAHEPGCTARVGDGTFTPDAGGSLPIKVLSGSHPKIAEQATLTKARFLVETIYDGDFKAFLLGENVSSYDDGAGAKTLGHLNDPPPETPTPVPPTSAPETNESEGTDTGTPDSTPSLVDADIDSVTVEPAPAPAPVVTPAAPLLGEYLDGEEFIFNTPDLVPAWWGSGKEVLAAKGEGTMICGTSGLGKSTLQAQLVRASLGLQTHVLDQPVEPAPRVLVLAMDRPAQIARLFARLFQPSDVTTVRDRLIVRPGPPPADIAKSPEDLLRICEAAGLQRGDRLFIDSLKDAAIGLSEDAVGSGYHRARAIVIAAGIDVLELHHMVKRASDGTGAPKSLSDVYGSAWLVNGAGNVFVLSGDAGDSYIKFEHVKQSMEPFGPVTIVHDHDTGISTIDRGTDVTTIVRSAGAAGITVRDVAKAMFTKPAPTRNEEHRARRTLKRLTTQGVLIETPGAHGGAAGGRATSVWTINLTGTIPDAE